MKQYFQKTSCLFVALLVLGHLINPNFAHASHAQENADGAKIRIEHTDRLRTYSQRVAAATCGFALRGHAPDRTVLVEVTTEFSKDIVALREGDHEMGILTAATDRKINAAIDQITTIWDPMNVAVLAILNSNGVATNHAEVVFAQNLALLDAVNLLLSEEERKYANPYEMTMGDALILDLAGRQRMLTQMMMKETCLIAMGWEPEAHRKILAETEAFFGNSLDALRNGLPAMGIKPSRNPHIIQALDRVWEDWTAAKVVIDEAVADHIPTPEEVVAVRVAIEELLEGSQAIVELLSGEIISGT